MGEQKDGSVLKSFLIVCLIHLCPGIAQAEETVSKEWSRKAVDLNREIQAVLEGSTLSEAVEDELLRFAVTADRLSAEMTGLDGAEDLTCIFRGISEDTEHQVRLLHMPGERQSALRRLATLLHDAERIGLAASLIQERGEASAPNSGSTPPQCEADPESSFQYLIEQP